MPAGTYETPFTARVAREGTDLTVIAYGAMVHTALEATEDLDGASVEVLDLRSLVPLDEEAILARSRKTRKVARRRRGQPDVRRRRPGRRADRRAAPSRTSTARSRRVATPDVPIPFSPAARAGRAAQRRHGQGGRAVSSSSTETLVDVTMPQMGVSVSEGTIVEWRKQVGDWVAYEEPICEISTDKIDTEVPVAGRRALAEMLVEVGATVEVGTVLARIATDARPGEAHASEGAAAPPPPPTTARRPPRPATRRAVHAVGGAGAGRAARDGDGGGARPSCSASPPSTASTSTASRAPGAAGA